ncbi:uncharacterized protein [Halyomorpha halys]|uniref:uncharacterized protein isoform X2 n=1 Tax=Halyomorpha halys TaxID=286706 RepID=UPI0034D2BFEA
MESLCRFCAKPGSGIDVFGEEGQKRNLYSKIKLCLPINITMNDGMTTLICDSCIKKLNITYDFHTTSLSAQYHLRTLMETKDDCENSSFKKLDSNMNHSPKNSSNETTEVSINDSKISTQNNDHSLKTNNFSGIKIEAVQSIPINMFQNLMDPEEVKKNGKRLSEESDKPDTAKNFSIVWFNLQSYLKNYSGIK